MARVTSIRRRIRKFLHFSICGLLTLSVTNVTNEAWSQVVSPQKISDSEGGFTGILDDGDLFGTGVVGLGDLDGDSARDLAVGAIRDDDGGTNLGAVWVLFLNPDGTVGAHQKISATEGGFTGVLSSSDEAFGASLAVIGDLDDDGVADLAVGSPGDDTGGMNAGAIWILFLNSDGTVKSSQKITEGLAGFTDTLDSTDEFGISLAPLGDLDGDGVEDLVVGAQRDDDGGSNRGSIRVLFLNSNGTVKSIQKISDTVGGFAGVLDNEDAFGRGIASLGDVDGDAVVDLAVGALGDDDGGGDRGAVWVLFLNSNGTVKSEQKISQTQGGFTEALSNGTQFGLSAAPLGDINQDGVPDVAVGSVNGNRVWELLLNSDGTVSSQSVIDNPEPENDRFGWSLASLGDLAGDGVVAVGAPFDDDGGADRGSVWVLSLTAPAGPDIDVAPLALDFGNVALPGSNMLMVTVSNEGSEDLTVSSIDLEPESSAAFSISFAPILPAVVSPEATVDVEIAFTPMSLEMFAAVLEILSDDLDEDRVTVDLTGAGVASEAPPSEQIDNTIDFIEDSVAEGNLEGEGPGGSGDGRLGALINQIEAAGDLINDGMCEDDVNRIPAICDQACVQLLDALKRTDGDPKPPDFVTGDAATQLALLIEVMRDAVGCQ